MRKTGGLAVTFYSSPDSLAFPSGRPAESVWRTPAEIQQIVSEFKSGELTQKEFCRRQGLTLSTLGRYLSRVRAASEASNRELVAVELAVKKGGAEASGGGGLSVSVASGRRIVVEAGFDEATLQRLVQVLERM